MAFQLAGIDNIPRSEINEYELVGSSYSHTRNSRRKNKRSVPQDFLPQLFPCAQSLNGRLGAASGLEMIVYLDRTHHTEQHTRGAYLILEGYGQQILAPDPSKMSKSPGHALEDAIHSREKTSINCQGAKSSYVPTSGESEERGSKNPVTDHF